MQEMENRSSIYIEKQTRPPDFVMPYEHSHNYCEIFYLKTGSCCYYVNKAKYHLEKGSLFLVRPGDSHSTSYEGPVPCERFIIACSPLGIPQDFLERHPEAQKLLQTSGKILLKENARQQVEDLFLRMLAENSHFDEYCSEFICIFLMQLLLVICRGGTLLHEQYSVGESASADIETALDWLERNYSSPVTLDEVAGLVNLSPVWFSRKFRKETGVTFKEYLNRLRIRNAVQALLTTDDSITKIAMDCGFNSSNYFKDCFHRINGISPREFRKQYRKSPLL